MWRLAIAALLAFGMIAQARANLSEDVRPPLQCSPRSCIDPRTGDYLFTHVGSNAFTLAGRGTVSVSGGIRTLTDSRSDRQINANYSISTQAGKATITVQVSPLLRKTFVITQTGP